MGKPRDCTTTITSLPKPSTRWAKPELVDAKGGKHDWRQELAAALSSRQKPDGSWVNERRRWMEGDPNLVTAYALLALSYCKPAGK